MSSSVEHVEEGEILGDDSGIVLVDENNGASVEIPERKLKESHVNGPLDIASIQETVLASMREGKDEALAHQKGCVSGRTKGMGGCCNIGFYVPRGSNG